MNDRSTTPPINLHEQTRVRLPLVMLVALLGAVATGAVVWSGDHAAVAEHTSQLGEHAARLRKLEEGQAKIDVMRNDVEWIRRTMEEQRRRGAQ